MGKTLCHLVTVLVLLFANSHLSAAAAGRTAPKGMSQDDIELYNVGVNLFNARDYEGACNKFQTVCKAHPDLVDLRAMYGAALIGQGKPEEAIAILHESEAINPEDSLTIFNLGTAYMLTGKHDRALEKFQKYIKLYPHETYSAESQARIDLLLTEHERTKGIESSKGKDNYLDEAMASGAVRWNSKEMPVAIFIESGAKVQGFRDGFTDILKQSFKEWAGASQGKLSFKYVTNPDEASIKCFWTDDATTLANPSEGGEALPIAATTGDMISAKLTILTKKNPLPTLPDSFIRSICLHEVGHTVGILGHSSQPHDAMLAAVSQNGQQVLSERDKKTIYLLYTSPDSVIKDHPLNFTNASYKGAQTSTTNKAVALNSEALAEINNQHYTKAIQLLEDAQKLAPDLDVIYINLARVYNELGTEARLAHDFSGVTKYYDLAINNLIKAKRKDLAIQYCDFMIRASQYDESPAQVIKYQNLKRQLAEKK